MTFYISALEILLLTCLLTYLHAEHFMQWSQMCIIFALLPLLSWFARQSPTVTWSFCVWQKYFCFNLIQLSYNSGQSYHYPAVAWLGFGGPFCTPSLVGPTETKYRRMPEWTRLHYRVQKCVIAIHMRINLLKTVGAMGGGIPSPVGKGLGPQKIIFDFVLRKVELLYILDFGEGIVQQL